MARVYFISKERERQGPTVHIILGLDGGNSKYSARTRAHHITCWSFHGVWICVMDMFSYKGHIRPTVMLLPRW